MVDDALGRQHERFARSRIDGMPRNGIDQLLRDCDTNLEKVFPFPKAARFALIDGDRLHDRKALGLAGDAALADRRAAVVGAYPQVNIVVIDAGHPRDSNIEGLLKVVAACMGAPLDDRSPALTKQKGALNARDEIFFQAARRPDSFAGIRQQQPSLAALVDDLATLLRQSPST